MSLASRKIDDATAFDLEIRTPISATVTAGDAIAKRERQLATISQPMAVSYFQFGTQKIEFEYPDHGQGLPRWVTPVMESICSRWGVNHNWDSYGAQPTNIIYVSRLMRELFPLMQDNSPIPVITPLPDGGVQAEWYKVNETLEIVVSSEEAPHFNYFVENPTGPTEGRLDQNFSYIRQLIATF